MLQSKPYGAHRVLGPCTEGADDRVNLFAVWLDRRMAEHGIPSTALARAYAAVPALTLRTDDLRLQQPRARTPRGPVREIGEFRQGVRLPQDAAAFRLGRALGDLGVPTCGVVVVARTAEGYLDAERADEDDLSARFENMRYAALGQIAHLRPRREVGLRWDRAYRAWRRDPQTSDHPREWLAIFAALRALSYRRRAAVS
jgi:hypothetical protein